MSKTALTIRFSNSEAAEWFAQWLADRGVEDYKKFMRKEEAYVQGAVTATSFNFETVTHVVGTKITHEYIVQTKCGRLDQIAE